MKKKVSFHIDVNKGWESGLALEEPAGLVESPFDKSGAELLRRGGCCWLHNVSV